MRRTLQAFRWHLVAVLALALTLVVPALPASAQYYGGYGYGGYGYPGYGYGGYGYGGYGYGGYGYSGLFGYGSYGLGYGLGYGTPVYGTGYAYGTYAPSYYSPYSPFSGYTSRPYGYSDPLFGPLVYGIGMVNDPCVPGGINFYGVPVTCPDLTTTTP